MPSVRVFFLHRDGFLCIVFYLMDDCFISNLHSECVECVSYLCIYKFSPDWYWIVNIFKFLPRHFSHSTKNFRSYVFTERYVKYHDKNNDFTDFSIHNWIVGTATGMILWLEAQPTILRDLMRNFKRTTKPHLKIEWSKFVNRFWKKKKSIEIWTSKYRVNLILTLRLNHIKWLESMT